MIPATKAKQTAPQYVLGHSPEELERLIRQSSYYNQATEQVQRQAGIGPGMTVLDVGCGAGDVAFVAARLVGPGGRVIALDRSQEALALAEYRAGEMGLANIQFLQTDLNAFTPDAPVDAVVGRLVLLYQADPLASLQHLRQSVKPGGVMAFQEFNMPFAGSWPVNEFFRQCSEMIILTFEKAGMDPILGSRLYFHFQSAGLKSLQYLSHTCIEIGENVLRFGEYVAYTIHSLLPAARQLGVPIPDGLDLERLPAQMKDFCLAHKTSATMPMLVSVWGKA